LRGAPDQRPDTLLVDWKLPGADALTHLPASIGGNSSTPLPRRILLVSSYGRERLHSTGRWQGQLVKPVTASTLAEVLRGGDSPRVGRAAPVPDVSLHGLRVLLVEDNPLNQTVACGLLEHLGALVDVMENGRQAVDWLREHADQYQVVLMDVQMPVMDGFTATRLIRDELKLDLPVIAMSAGVMLPEQQQCLASGMNDFIGKPIDYLQMRDTLARHAPAGVQSFILADIPAPVVPASIAVAPSPASVSAPNPVTADAPNTLFDPDKMLSYVRGKPARLRDIISMIEGVAAAGSAPVDEGRQLLDAGQIADASRHFHTLKGSLGNLGARQAWDIAQQLEQAIKTDQRDQWEPLLAEAAMRLQAMAAAAGQWLQAHPELRAALHMRADQSTLDPERLRELRQRLEEQNIGACDLYARLREALGTRLDPPRLASLDQAMQRLDFRAAQALLEGA
jgi:CheY-like chemotaxis protein